MGDEKAPASIERARRQSRLPPLLHSTVFLLTDREPRFVRHVAEGDIAYYGLLLQASGDPAIRDYLVLMSRDGLWEFHAGYGVSAADSALVLEGLLAQGGQDQLLQRAGERLVDTYYSDNDGAFRTVISGRAPYWLGVSVETTAHVAFLLDRLDPERWGRQVRCSVDYVGRQQHPEGYWEGRWFPSIILPTYYAVRLLTRMQDRLPVDRDALGRARDYLCSSQLRNGSWSGLVVDTSAAILALSCLGAAADEIEKGRTWLASRLATRSLAGEPVLYYWYDDKDGKIFFSSRDHSGRVAAAWAKLAAG